MTHPSKKTNNELRRFGLVMTVPLSLIGIYLWWKGRGTYPYVLGAAGFFLAAGFLTPGVLRPVEKVWMKFAEIMGAIMTRVILTLAFYVVITPFGLLLRLMGKDLLDIRMDRPRDTYWIPIEPDGPAFRSDKPY
jgi:hypothetical protein